MSFNYFDNGDSVMLICFYKLINNTIVVGNPHALRMPTSVARLSKSN